jgi:hypothetical protein
VPDRKSGQKSLEKMHQPAVQADSAGEKTISTQISCMDFCDMFNMRHLSLNDDSEESGGQLAEDTGRREIQEQERSQ